MKLKVMLLIYLLSISAPVMAIVINLPSDFNILLSEQNSTSLYFYSEPGDYIGQGHEWSYKQGDGDFWIGFNLDNGVAFRFNNSRYVPFGESVTWTTDFAAALEEGLQVGYYENATRFPFQDFNSNGLNISGDGRGSNRLGGHFEILEILLGPEDTVMRFDALFVQYSENESAMGTPALFGRVRYNSNFQVIPEPSSILLFCMGSIGLLIFRKIKNG